MLLEIWRVLRIQGGCIQAFGALRTVLLKGTNLCFCGSQGTAPARRWLVKVENCSLNEVLS
jgi:hypothetical protein